MTPTDQDGNEISEGQIILDSRGRCYRVVKTPPTILAQRIVSGVQHINGRDQASEYVRAYHCFIIDEAVNAEDGKRLHKERLAAGDEARREAMRERHRGTDAMLRSRGIRR